jgi:hypothetical protein
LVGFGFCFASFSFPHAVSIIETATTFSRLFERELHERQTSYLARNLHELCLDFLAQASQCLAKGEEGKIETEEMDVESNVCLSFQFLFNFAILFSHSRNLR